ncbi:helix-turn-helix domain-containing protein [Bernardetia sp. OM2101]|uniref:helix-turn-helix domain-containing protein n=1 Tax=Bernardetia sp. OM2101 TaxID=3344876 RepID=UPI0035D08353
MIGNFFKSVVDNSEYSHDEIAEKLKISSSTLYNFYKRDSIETKYVSKLSEITGEPVSKIMGEGYNILEKTQKLEIQKEQPNDLLKENYSLAKKLADAERELKDLYKMIIQNNLKIDLGKAKASSIETNLFISYSASEETEKEIEKVA